MASSLVNDLFPPIIDTYMPAFVKDQDCRVYFSLSSFNSQSQIQSDCVQVTVRYQNNNKSALSTSLYPSQIKLCHLYQVTDSNDRDAANKLSADDNYYIIISPSDMEGKTFGINQYYKVQIRFTKSFTQDNKVINKPKTTGLNTWLSDYSQYFSEWSTICLIKPICKPTITLKHFSNTATTVLSAIDLRLNGKVTFGNGTEGQQEKVKSYHIYLYNNLNQLVYQSKQIYQQIGSDTSQINYKIPYNIKEDQLYTLSIQIITDNLYSFPSPVTFPFIYKTISYEPLNIAFTAKPDKDHGRMEIHIAQPNGIIDASFIKHKFKIRRASSKDNFTLWDQIYTFTFADRKHALDMYWFDYTVQSGVWYIYSIQKYQQQNEAYGSDIVKIKEPVMAEFEYAFLTAEDQTLRLCFDVSINSFAHTISQNQTQTIGGKYPFISRNAATNYRTFPISGTISCLMDMGGQMFSASESDIYNNVLTYYNDYKSQNKVIAQNNYIYQKAFRDKVIDFLYKNNVKLYKSTTQGNVLVKLMNITFTPNEQLDRRIYSFSCTAYQVDDYTVQNIHKYNIQSTDKEDDQINLVEDFIGRDIYVEDEPIRTLNNGMTSFPIDKDYINDYIVQHFNHLLPDSYRYQLVEISYLKLQLTNPNSYIYLKMEGDTQNRKFFVNPDGTLELTNVNIQNIFFPDNISGTFDYIIKLKLIENAAIQHSQSFEILPLIGQTNNNGHAYERFKALNSISIYNQILQKHQKDYIIFAIDSNNNGVAQSRYKESIKRMIGFRIEANPNAVFYWRAYDSNNITRIGLDNTKLWNLYNINNDFTKLEEHLATIYDIDMDVRQLYFYGLHLLDYTDRAKEKDSSQYYVTIEPTNNVYINDTEQVFSTNSVIDITYDSATGTIYDRNGKEEFYEYQFKDGNGKTHYCNIQNNGVKDQYDAFYERASDDSNIVLVPQGDGSRLRAPLSEAGAIVSHQKYISDRYLNEGLISASIRNRIFTLKESYLLDAVQYDDSQNGVEISEYNLQNITSGNNIEQVNQIDNFIYDNGLNKNDLTPSQYNALKEILEKGANKNTTGIELSDNAKKLLDDKTLPRTVQTVLYRLILTYIQGGKQRWIYYTNQIGTDGDWYIVDQNDDIAAGTTQGIVDYYCDLLKERFGIS